MENIIVFGSHSDDLEIGMGSTVAKYSEEGKNIISVIFSSGEKSNPLVRKEVLVEERKEEAIKVGEFLGVKETIFLDLEDRKLNQEIEKPEVKKKIKEIIQEYKPRKIFVHSKFDPHADHRAVNEIVFKTLYEVDPEKNISVFVYEVWNVVNETHPKIYVDVSKTFKKKIEAMKKFKSQKLFVYSLMLSVIIKAKICGLQNKTKYAERFYKIR